MRIASLVAFLFLAVAPLAAMAGDEHALTIETAEGESHAFSVELVVTADKQRRGLMYRTELADDAGRLGVCLDQLDEKVSRVIRTAFFEGVTYEVLAQREETPLGTMKSWIRRGLLKLRSCLEQ